MFQANAERGDQGATWTYELDTEYSKDAQTIFEKAQQINKVRSNHILNNDTSLYASPCV